MIITYKKKDYTKAKVAAQKIFELFDRIPKIDNWNTNKGETPILESIGNNAHIQFDSVDFFYPSRKEVQVLSNFTLSIRKGQKIALVGSSGCGKSTITQLLERFYDPSSGNVKINGHSFENLNLEWLRGKMSIVSQEPILMDTSIGKLHSKTIFF